MQPEQARRRLLAERAETAKQVRRLDASFADIVDAARDSNVDDEHDTEGTTIAVERQQVFALARTARRRLAEIDAALDRVEQRTYGVCRQCQGPIADGRLDARPTAERCIGCAAKPDPRR